MYKDHKIQLSLAAFIFFLMLWCVLSFFVKPDEGNHFLMFVEGATASSWSMLMLFIKPDGGNEKDTEVKHDANPDNS